MPVLTESSHTELSNAARSGVSRRRFLAASLTASAVAVAGTPRFASADHHEGHGGGDFGPFKMGVQSWTLRTYDFPTAVRHAASFGLEYVEFTTRHVPISTAPDYVAEKKGIITAGGLKPSAMGVVKLTEDENANRTVFEFAKAMGLISITANPNKSDACFDHVEKLAEEFQMPVAIHNHGPGSNFDKSSEVVEWTKGRSPLLGACVDCGHYLRSDEKPEEIIEALGERVLGVHLKDAKPVTDEAEKKELMATLPKNRANRLKKEGKVMTIVGEGSLNLPGTLSALRQIGYANPVSLEYEENEKNPLSDIAVCLDHVKAAIKEIA